MEAVRRQGRAAFHIEMLIFNNPFDIKVDSKHKFPEYPTYSACQSGTPFQNFMNFFMFEVVCAISSTQLNLLQCHKIHLIQQLLDEPFT